MIRRSVSAGLLGFAVLSSAALTQAAYIQSEFLPVAETAEAGSMPLAADGQAAPVYYSAVDAAVVGIAAEALADDVERVAGLVPLVSTNAPSSASNAVFVGTVGASPLIDDLVSGGTLDVSAIAGEWESYLATIVTNPVTGVDRALVIAGSDRRGTAFGVFALSEAMGVSPWHWFGDVPAMQKPAVHVGAGTYVQPAPGVKYRGIFINDEDWGVEPWARQTFDPYGDIGPTTYAKVFELLLRLRSNFIWPAMHTTTEPFYTVPGNKEIADDYAIVMGTTHHEPMMRNTLEWDDPPGAPWGTGDYDYWANSNGVYQFWEERVIETKDFENMHTVGMRGLWDDGIDAPPGTTNTEKKDMLQDHIIPDQRQMLSDHVNPDPTQVPQIFVPYKEALTLYRLGLQLADDITLVWPDDNHGYIRQLSSAAERARGGGSGVYYHLSYWGSPRSYLWLCTTPPAMTWSEMMKAWDYDARRLWLVNVGDIKPGELGMEFFLRLARDPEAFRGFDQHTYLVEWATATFGSAYAEDIATILDEYYRLNIVKRPEQLDHSTSGFSFVDHGDEAQQRLDAFEAMKNAADAVYTLLSEDRRTAFYELVLYPVRGSYLLNRKILQAERSRLWQTQGRAATSGMAQEAQAAQDALQAETAYYNATNAAGKWNGMMTWTTSGEARTPYLMPSVGSYTPAAGAELRVAIEGSSSVLSTGVPARLPLFSAAVDREYFIDVFNAGSSAAAWTATASDSWITLSQTSGTADARIQVGIDWDTAPRGYAVPGSVVIGGAGSTYTVEVEAFYPLSLHLESLPAAVELDGMVEIEAEAYTTRVDGSSGAGWRRIHHATASRDGMTIMPVTAASIDPAAISSDTPRLTYEFHTFSSGYTTIQTACLPTHTLTSDHAGCRYAVSLNGDDPQVVDIETAEYSGTWSANVLRAAAIASTVHHIADPGLQTVTIYMIDPGVVLDKVTIHINPYLLEAEALEATYTAGRVYRTFGGESGLSGGEATVLESTTVGDYVTLTLPWVEAGSYALVLRCKEGASRGIIQLSLADSPGGSFANIGPELDLYNTSFAYTEFDPIPISVVTSGAKCLKLQVAGKNPSSSDYWIVLDAIKLLPPGASSSLPTVFEAEDLAMTGTDGIEPYTFVESPSVPGASGGSAMAYLATAVGQSVTFTVPGLPAGTFDVTVRGKKSTNRGIAQMSISDSGGGPFMDVGGVMDLYNSGGYLYYDFAPIRLTISTAGVKYLRFTVTGRNPSSSGYYLLFDSFTFDPVEDTTDTPTMDDWRLVYFGTTNNTGDGADLADPDGDGICNLLEYSAGRHPTVINGSIVNPGFTNDHFSITFTRMRDATDITYSVLAGSDLMEEGTSVWSSASAPYPGGSAESVSVTVADPDVVGEHEVRFLAMQVSRP